jgi:hypothetical protein
VGEPADRKGSLITHERLIAMKRSGMIPADLPPTPSLSIMQYLGGFSLWITIGLFIILGRLTKDQDVKQPAPSRPRSPGVPAQPPSQSAPESRQTVAPDGLDLSIRDTPPPPPPLPQNRARCANPSCRRLLVPGKRQCPHCGSPYR